MTLVQLVLTLPSLLPGSLPGSSGAELSQARSECLSVHCGPNPSSTSNLSSPKIVPKTQKTLFSGSPKVDFRDSRISEFRDVGIPKIEFSGNVGSPNRIIRNSPNPIFGVWGPQIELSRIPRNPILGIWGPQIELSGIPRNPLFGVWGIPKIDTSGNIFGFREDFSFEVETR